MDSWEEEEAPPHFTCSPRNTRGKIFVPKPSLVFYANCYSFLGPKMFNSIPKLLSDCKDFNLFSKKLKSWLLTQENIDFLIKVQI